MKYRFILIYTPTNGTATSPRLCSPVYGDNLAVVIDRQSDEWYYTRKLDGKIYFERDDYNWIMQQDFDGTFTLTIESRTEDSQTWHPYFEASFSRANLEIDEDNQNAALSSFIEGVYNAIENGKNEDYDLMKIIPDSDTKEVQGLVHPALAMVDECSINSKPTTSDVFCGSPFTAGGYNENTEMFWASDRNMASNPNGYLCAIIAEAKVLNGAYKGLYSGIVAYATDQKQWEDNVGRVYTVYITSPGGMLSNADGSRILRFGLYHDDIITNRHAYVRFYLDNMLQDYVQITEMYIDNPYYSPMSYSVADGNIEIKFHYIYSHLLTCNIFGNKNYLQTSSYYQGIEPFEDTNNLLVFPSVQTVEQPNGHRLLPGTGEQGSTPQYYAPPNSTDTWIPVDEENWDYCSIWYQITPTVSNGLLDPSKIGTFRWTRCWSIGTCLRHLLNRITDGKVVFSEDSTTSRFLYDSVNPVAGHEPFQYLVTQKTNVMSSSGGESAARCIVRLQWYLELLRNAFNCYYWLEKRNDGKYQFRVEHIEFFRHGGKYGSDPLARNINLTTLRPLRNIQGRKRYSDQTNKYSYELDNMVEKYTFSWQGEGGSDAFKGNPMFFKAGWIEKSSSESHEVDNIFADLAWLMLNANTEIESSNNRAGLFLFAGYVAASNIENAAPTAQTLSMGSIGTFNLWLTAPLNATIIIKYRITGEEEYHVFGTYTGTGEPQVISSDIPTRAATVEIDFGSDYSDIMIHRIHLFDGPLYNIPNVPDMLNPANYLQNGPLAWPWLQNEHLHYDIPARKWSYLYDDLQEVNDNNAWETNGTVKMVQKQEVGQLPMPDKSTEDDIMSITGIHTAIEGGKTGIITNATVNLGTRNAQLTIIYDPIPTNN